MKTIFLDFDGVLHTSSIYIQTPFSKLSHFDPLLKDYAFDVVVSFPLLAFSLLKTSDFCRQQPMRSCHSRESLEAVIHRPFIKVVWCRQPRNTHLHVARGSFWIEFSLWKGPLARCRCSSLVARWRRPSTRRTWSCTLSMWRWTHQTY